MSFKDKTISGFLWSFIERSAAQIITFIVGIILARLLSPREFGLLGMMMVFIAVSSVFIQSGFNQALIRKNDCTENDFSTVFYFNLLISIVFYFILFFSAGLISDFYDEPRLQQLIRVLGLGLIINALTIVQRTKITKRIDFRLLTKISVISSILSGLVGIIMAIMGYGIWSLVAKTISMYFITGVLLWLWNNWKPKLIFSISSFKELWSFGSRLMILGVFDAIHREVYQIVIGKFYPAAYVGQFNRAETFKRLPEQNLSQILQRVTLPAMATIQDDFKYLSNSYKKLINATFLVASFSMVILSAVSVELVEVLIGEKWKMAGEFLQILCISSIFYPLSAINQSILKTKGEANHILYIGLVMKALTIPLILIVIFIDIKTMLYGLIAHKLIGYILTAHYGGKLINYDTTKQVKNFIPPALILSIIYIVLLLINNLLTLPIYQSIIISLFLGGIISLSCFELFKIDSYLFLKKLAKEKINTYKNRRK